MLQALLRADYKFLNKETKNSKDFERKIPKKRDMLNQRVTTLQNR